VAAVHGRGTETSPNKNIFTITFVRPVFSGNATRGPSARAIDDARRSYTSFYLLSADDKSGRLVPFLIDSDRGPETKPASPSTTIVVKSLRLFFIVQFTRG